MNENQSQPEKGWGGVGMKLAVFSPREEHSGGSKGLEWGLEPRVDIKV